MLPSASCISIQYPPGVHRVPLIGHFLYSIPWNHRVVLLSVFLLNLLRGVQWPDEQVALGVIRARHKIGISLRDYTVICQSTMHENGSTGANARERIEFA